MASINQATLIGYVGDNPTIAKTKNGKEMAIFMVATTDQGYKKRDGSTVDSKTDWHNVVLFGKLAEIAQKYIGKGTQVYVQGKLQTRSYDDKNGIKRWVTEIIGDKIQVLDRKHDVLSSQALNGFDVASDEPPF